jgi:hypothetical protein
MASSIPSDDEVKRIRAEAPSRRNLLPKLSRDEYFVEYSAFCDWMGERDEDLFSTKEATVFLVFLCFFTLSWL